MALSNNPDALPERAQFALAQIEARMWRESSVVLMQAGCVGVVLISSRSFSFTFQLIAVIGILGIWLYSLWLDHRLTRALKTERQLVKRYLQAIGDESKSISVLKAYREHKARTGRNLFFEPRDLHYSDLLRELIAVTKQKGEVEHE